MNTNHPIVKNIKKVLKSDNPEMLNKAAYKFLTIKIGFSAMYNHTELKNYYKDEGITAFARDLMTGPVTFHQAGMKEQAALLNNAGKPQDASIALAIWEETKLWFEQQGIQIHGV